MQKKIIITISLILVLTVTIIFGILVVKDKDDYILENNGVLNLECLYYNELDFININDYSINEDVGTIKGFIVPHHLIAKDLIHEAFQATVKKDYKTIVIFGPDHESVDKGKVFTSSSRWQTPFGILNAESDVIRSISKLDFVIENDEKLTIEHSVSGLVPYIKYYYNNANIVPIVLTKQLTLENLDKLLTILIDNIDVEETLFIASIDFSHYLSLEEADKMDKISAKAILNKDLGKIMSFTNDNLDSPNSIAAILKSMEIIKSDNIKLLNNSNSQIILNKKVEETTSYITFLFYNDDK